ncbi:flagellar motor switch protein FliN [Clostridium tepidiprofundi DSM 19306]|uniref:Flagellar motor switch protein FliN n=2 Tax=Clostridium TaxID=1485 RepID=A0A151B4R5_9CLOT|nr:flagellar motor switch protein FliN [Clostridium tepidiprofundi DSM 19306]
MIMSNGFLSQEEIDSLLNGGADNTGSDVTETTNVDEEVLTDIEKDLLGEVGNISMGSASTALSTIIGQQVNITTPVVSVVTLKKLKESFEVPNIALDVKYTSGITGKNLLVLKVTDAAVIANLMMGGNGRIENFTELSEIEISAVSEAMNQMVGSAATSMATMFAREVNISPPSSKIWDEKTNDLADEIEEDEPVVLVSFRLIIGDLVDSTMMQILPIDMAKKIVSIMMGNDKGDDSEADNNMNSDVQASESQQHYQTNTEIQQEVAASAERSHVQEKPIEVQPPVNVKQASFQTLTSTGPIEVSSNINLILDVPLEISVVLGRCKKNIKEILDLGTGSLIELDKLAEEPVEILVNGKKIAYGEVVVVDENFGVRITSIVSNEERVKSLGK